MAQPKRKDKSRVVLRKGEVQRANGTYHYCWTDGKGKRHFVYAKTLEELRDKEAEIEKDKSDGIKAEAKYTTINDLFDLWKQLKRGLKNNTFENYKYMYDTFVRPEFGKTRISSLKKSDVKRFYNRLADDRGLQPSTIDSIHTVLHQVLDMAVDDDYLRSNPSSNVLRELKQSHCFETEKRRGLTKPEQDLFLDFLKRNHTYSHWYPIFAIMVGSGLRVGEITGFVALSPHEWYRQLFERLDNSKFRSSFHLKQKDIDYINEKGLDTIRQHAKDFIAKREAPAYIANDGKQTPMRGHPVFIAKHATATCCRECIR